MELEDIIYVVVTIVIFIVSMLSRGKKKEKPATPNLEEKEYNLNEFEKLLTRKEEFAEATEQENVFEDDAEPQTTIKMGQAVNKIISEKKEKTRKKLESEEEHEDGFDVKSAVIYSSILERKKFRN